MTLITNAPARTWTSQEYSQMVEYGILQADDRVELIEGEIVTMPPHSPRHSLIIRKLTKQLVRLFGETHDICPQVSLDLNARSVPEPDFALVPIALSGASHPQFADLIIEVSFSSLAFDRNEKASLYAKSGIPELWIVNIVADRLEVLRQPQPDPGGIYGFAYADKQHYEPSARVSPLFAPSCELAVTDILCL